MTTPTMTRKICTFFFTGLDRSRLINLDRSRFEKQRNHYQLTDEYMNKQSEHGWEGGCMVGRMKSGNFGDEEFGSSRQV